MRPESIEVWLKSLSTCNYIWLFIITLGLSFSLVSTVEVLIFIAGCYFLGVWFTVIGTIVVIIHTIASKMEDVE